MRLPMLSLIICMLTGTASTLSASMISLNEWNWTDLNGGTHEYKVMLSKGISWENAFGSLEDDWHLATITSEDEQHSVISGLSGLAGEYWLGGFQSEKGDDPENNWEWTTGETWDYTHWAPGEPNDAYGASSEQHVALWSRWGSDWKWNDEGYLPNIKGFVAEKSHAVPEPSPFSLLLFNGVVIGAFIRRKKDKKD